MRETGQLSQFSLPLSAFAGMLLIGQLAAAQPREPVDDSNVAASLSKSRIDQSEVLSPDIAKRLELPVAGGIYVKDVEKDSPAERAGIQQGDIFIRFDSTLR